MKIALLPGGFKPPHLGHYNMAKYLADFADNVIVRIGQKEREGIGAPLALEVWNFYKEFDPDPRAKKLTISVAQSPSPVKDVYDFVEKIAPEGSTVILGLGEKDASDGRYNNIPKFAEPRNIKAEIELVPPQAGGISGTRMREIIKSNDKKEFFKYIPEFLPEEIKEELWTKLVDSTMPTEVDEMMAGTMNREEMAKHMANMKKLRKFFSKQGDQMTQIPTNLTKGLRRKLYEGRYDKLSTEISSEIFSFYKDVHDKGQLEGEKMYNVGTEKDPNNDISSSFLDFQLFTTVEITDDLYKPDGGANTVENPPYILINFQIPKNPTWSEVSMDLKDVVRHELEHLTQSGSNALPGKEMEDDIILRKLIQQELLPKAEYFKLEQEVDAMLQGMYFKAKKSKTPFKQVVDDYLDKVNLTPKEKEEVLDVWKKRLPAILPQSSLDENFPPYKANQVQQTRYRASDTFTNDPKKAKKLGYLEDNAVDEGDTYEKMAAKGKKAGNLKQGTVRKRLNIPKGEKIPLSLINKELSRLKKIKKRSAKNQKYYKALTLAKTLKTTTHKENIDPKAQKKHKGKAAPYGSAYEPVKEGDPKVGTGKKPKGSGRRLYTDENPKDTVSIKFSTRQDIVDTLTKKSFKAKSHARQSQIINLIHQRVRAAYGRAKDPAVKKRLKTGLDYITKRKEASKRKTQRMRKEGLFSQEWWLDIITEDILDKDINEVEFKHISPKESKIKDAIKDVEKKARLKVNRDKPVEYEQLSLNKIMLSKVLGREKLGKEHQGAWEKLKKEYNLKESFNLNEGGAAGHMAHPFNLPNVKTGQDLIKSFEQAADSLKNAPGSVKIDGVNASIRLINLDGKRVFAMDRGSKKALDLRGVTKADLEDRFGAGHGMIKSGGDVLDIFNAALPSIQEELNALGLIDDPNVMFNMEYVSGKSNVQDYGKNFLAIHGLLKVETKEVQGARKMLTKRVTTEKPFAQSDMDELLKKLEPFAKKKGFEIYGSVPTTFTKDPDFKSALNTRYTIDTAEGDQTKTLAQWLNGVTNIPKTDRLKINIEETDSIKDVGALSKQVYFAVFGGENVDSLFSNEQEVNKAIQGATTYLATEKLGDAILDVLDSPMGSVNDHEGVVIRDDKISPKPFKVTGKFITGGVSSQFQSK